MKKELAAAEAKQGRDHPDQQELLLKLGNAYRLQGGYVPAAQYVERALSIVEKTTGPQPVQVAAFLDRLGTLYLLQGDTARARRAYTRAQPVLRRELGPKNPGYGLHLLHLGRLHLESGERKQAGEALAQATAAFGTVLSQAAHQWTEANLDLGLLYLGLERYRLAEEQLAYALTVRSEALEFGDRDEALADMAPIQGALGRLYLAVGLDDLAEPLLLSALAGHEKRHGKDHAVSEDVLQDLAALYEGKRDAPRTREFADRARAVHRKSVGYRHAPDRHLRPVARATSRPCADQGPYTDARVGDEATYEDGEGALLVRRRIAAVTSVVALVAEDDWDDATGKWVEGKRMVQPLCATMWEELEGAEGEWGSDTATVGAARIPCRTFTTSNPKARYWLAPGVVPAGGLVAMTVEGNTSRRLRAFARAAGVVPAGGVVATSVEGAIDRRLGTSAADAAPDAVLLRIEAPVGRVTRYRTQSHAWYVSQEKLAAVPDEIRTYVTTESVTAVEGGVLTVTEVVDSSAMEMTDVPQQVGEAMRHAKDMLRGLTTVRRIDGRGRVLSSEVTRIPKGTEGQDPGPLHAGGAFTLAEGPVRVGDRWTTIEAFPLGPGRAEVTATVEVAYRLERIDVKGAARVAVISMQGTIVRPPPPQGKPAGTTWGEIRLDVGEHRLVGLTMSLDTTRGIKAHMTKTAE